MFAPETLILTLFVTPTVPTVIGVEARLPNGQSNARAEPDARYNPALVVRFPPVPVAMRSVPAATVVSVAGVAAPPKPTVPGPDNSSEAGLLGSVVIGPIVSVWLFVTVPRVAVPPLRRIPRLPDKANVAPPNNFAPFARITLLEVSEPGT